ncbi:hypothetical protein [Nocardia panacis]|nr:hypothetical protein [Nocardia panacis]
MKRWIGVVGWIALLPALGWAIRRRAATELDPSALGVELLLGR